MVITLIDILVKSVWGDIKSVRFIYKPQTIYYGFKEASQHFKQNLFSLVDSLSSEAIETLKLVY